MARPKHRYLPHRSHLGLEMAARACPGPAGVSGRALWACFGAARALEMSVRDLPKQCYSPHRSNLGLKMATWSCLGAPGVSGRPVWACCGVAQALKMAAQSLQCSHLALEIASQACPGAGGAPGRPIGLVLALPGCQNGCPEPPVCLKRRFRLLKHCYR